MQSQSKVQELANNTQDKIMRLVSYGAYKNESPVDAEALARLGIVLSTLMWVLEEEHANNSE